MNIVEELEKLEGMHHSGTLSDEEFAQAKLHLLRDAEEKSPAEIWRNQKVLELKLDLERVEREWLVEREKYVLTNRYGARSLPDEVGEANTVVAIIGGITFLGVGVVFMSRDPVLGLITLFMAAAIGGMLLTNDANATKYRAAKAQYVQRRDALQAELDKANGAGQDKG